MDKAKKISIDELEVVKGGAEITPDSELNSCCRDEVHHQTVGRNGEATMVLYMCEVCGKMFWQPM